MEECFQKSCNSIQTGLECYANDIWAELRSSINECLNHAVAMQEQQIKGNLQYLVFSFMQYGIYLDNLEMRIDALDDSFYLDEQESEAVGAVVAGVGSIAAAVTYMHDKENSTASEPGTHIKNAHTASLITAAVIAVFWAAPYGAKALATEVTQGLPVTVLFGEVYTFEQVASLMSVGTEGIALLNAFFQMCELGMFFSGMKELGELTGAEGYDERMDGAGCQDAVFYWAHRSGSKIR